MSAIAPLGRPSRNTGKVEQACTSATQMGEVVIDVISQAAATSFIHMHRLAISQVLHSMRNAAILKGASADSEAGSAVSTAWVDGKWVGCNGSGLGMKYLFHADGSFYRQPRGHAGVVALGGYH